MNSAAPAHAVAAKLREMLARGVDLAPSTMRFIDSTFPDPSPGGLAALIADDAGDSGSERDSLCALLFSPEESLAIELEGLLAELTPDRDCADRVAELLSRPPLRLVFRLPAGRGEFRAEMSAPLARRMVSQLRIDRELPAALSAAIAGRLCGPERLRLRVMIRAARFEFTASRTDFLCALIRDFAPATNPDWPCVAFALEFLAGDGEPADIRGALAARKQGLIRALHHGLRQRDALAQATVELLISRGQRLTWVDEEDTRRQISYIDRISAAVFGAIAPGEPVALEERVAFTGPPDVGAIIRRLL